MKRAIRNAIVILCATIASGELLARYVVGLGTPPLSVTHDRIDYLFKPNQDVTRFGNRQLYNEFGMRSSSILTWGNRRRVLVFGDSVLNGGNLTDHEMLATTRATRLDGNTVFGNISAGSWGPDNFLMWIETYGLLGAEGVILVLSSHDAKDPPEFQTLDPTTHPTERPFSALWEGLTRYLPRYIPKPASKFLVPKVSLKPRNETSIGKEGLVALPLLLDVFENEKVRVCVVLHETRSELVADSVSGFSKIIDLLRERNISFVWLKDFVGEPRKLEIYRDDIHINDFGQERLSDAILGCNPQSVSSIP